MSAEIKVNRIKAANAGTLGLLGSTMPTVLEANANIKQTRTNFVERRDMETTLSTLGKFCQSAGFDPTRQFLHVANIDTEMWSVILGMFARYDEESMEFMDDGLLYKYDETAGCVKLNKDFFYAIVQYLEASGYPCDPRKGRSHVE